MTTKDKEAYSYFINDMCKEGVLPLVEVYNIGGKDTLVMAMNIKNNIAIKEVDILNKTIENKSIKAI